MRIEHLHLKDFRSHRDTKIDLDRFNFVVGPNAAGKTSIAAAIQFLLTGKCQFTTEGGAGADDLIRLGAHKFYVAAKIGKTLIERSKGPKDHLIDIGGKSGPLSAMQEKIYKGLGVTADVLSACLNSNRFLAMDEKSQKALLAQVLASDKISIPSEIREKAISVDHVGFAAWTGEMGSVSDIDAAYKVFYDMRAQTNRDIKALGTVDEPEIPDDAPDFTATRKKLDDLRIELTAVTAQKARGEERYSADKRAVEEKRSELTRRKNEASKRQLTEAEADKLDKVAESAEKGIAFAAKIKTLNNSLNDKRHVLDQERAGKRAALIQKREGLQGLAEEKESRAGELIKIKSADCPTCARPLSAEDKAALGTRLDDEAVALRQEIDGIERELKALAESPSDTDEIADLRKKLIKLEAEYAAIGDVAAAEAKLRVHREAIIEADRCGRELKAIKDPVAPDTDAMGEKIKEFSGRIAKGEGILDQVRSVEREREAFADWKFKKLAFEAQLETLATLLDFFGPNGIKATLVGDKIGPFTMAMNRSLNQFGYVAQFTLEPYSFSMAEADGGQWRSLQQLSESEAWRFGVAFQIALAMVTGLKFVVIDRADVLDANSRGVLTAMLLDSDLDQAIVLSTTDKAAPEELPDGVKFVVFGEAAAGAA